ncbi:galactose mutarotase-like enzyme [Terriglobus roseus DSM 18391]|uniref:Aldose 1-epimerase n=1 Tax=Terriglobus roseus (strain DSM 18391 / NRRL B-41598 / KBS 63) TaxID=926566 RepID=I3ZFQ4_TERRK|nr:aldose epimerase family protein [Terriglobus roseus]AFL88072.1 galactose mutarotase-like enzyme [Terriglobus roseus DSM 18391]
MLKRTLFVLLLVSAGIVAHAEVTRASFGNMPDGRAVDVFTLTSRNVEAKVITYGARLIDIRTPDRNGKIADVMLGYDTLPEWLADRGSYNGSIVGRYGNRIANGRFTIDGKEYQVPPNDGPNALHGGRGGFDKKLWTAKQLPDGVELTLVSPDGDMGLPGTLTAQVTYTLKGNALKIDYKATTDKPTVVNLTNHTYFNLTGTDEDVLGHQLIIHGDRYTPTSKTLIPTGKLDSVANTPMDFRTSHTIGERIAAPFEALTMGGGYDHNWVLNGPDGVLKPAADVYEPKSGRTLKVTTTQPGVQFYSGNFLNGMLTGRGGIKYTKHMGFCLETQHFPDSPNEPSFPSTVLRPGQTASSTTIFTFGIKK